eukprot:5071833-Prymnesium_polylepis.1
MCGEGATGEYVAGQSGAGGKAWRAAKRGSGCCCCGSGWMRWRGERGGLSAAARSGSASEPRRPQWASFQDSAHRSPRARCWQGARRGVSGEV